MTMDKNKFININKEDAYYNRRRKKKRKGTAAAIITEASSRIAALQPDTMRLSFSF
jgi:hypothetical protein